jgi:ATP-dependent RNA helicase DDX54/DBP10
MRKKCMVFTSTRHSVDLISEILSAKRIENRGIYSSMDQAARKKNMEDFNGGVIDVLIVTDIASRGLDIPLLDVVINYDMTDEKNFIHRVGRAGRNGRVGYQYSMVSFDDIYHFYNIRDTHFKGKMEIGTVPQSIIDENGCEEVDLKEMRRVALNAYRKCLEHRKKVSIPGKEEILKMDEHSYFKGRDGEREQFLKNVRSYKNKFKGSYLRDGALKVDKFESPGSHDNKFKDQFYIPYFNDKPNNSLHCSAYSVCLDEKNKKTTKKRDRKEKVGALFKNWEKKRKKLENKRVG